MKIFGFDLAPLNVPLERRLQTISVFHFTVCFLFLGFSCLFFTLYILFFTQYYYLSLAYFAFYFYDRKTPARGGRRIQRFRCLKIWKYYADFFPLKLIKTCDLNPKKNYLFGCHPHGILCYSHFGNFCTEGTGFSEIFPGLTSYLTVLSGQFMFPLFRDYFMTSGAVEVSKESIEFLLSREDGGNAVCVIVGGASEALDANPGNFVVRGAKRRGFCRLALKHGADLVPVYSFGENDLYVQIPNPDGSKLRKFQEFCTKRMGFSPPIFHGRGIFNYTFGLLPYRHPLNTVVGEPIAVEKVAEPTNEQIEELHQKYFKALEELFEKHKSKYGVSESDHLVFKD